MSQPEWKFSAKFHYANTPDRSCNYLETRDCLDRQCIVGAIENYTMILRNRDSYSFNLTRDALRFIVHFLGDIHQPLHVCFYCFELMSFRLVGRVQLVEIESVFISLILIPIYIKCGMDY